MYNKQLIKTIILAGSRDFGRCPIASRLPAVLWPVAGKPVVQRLLDHLADQGLKKVVICAGEDKALLAESIRHDDRLHLELLDEPLPLGTAGCIRDAAGDGAGELLLVFPATIVCPPEIDILISAHQNGRSDLTVMLNPGDSDGQLVGRPADIYVCNPGILEYIPKEGYCDIKEGLIPKMLRAGKIVHAAVLPNHTGNFRNRQEYLCAIAGYLENAPKLNEDLSAGSTADLRHRKHNGSQPVWIAANVRIDPSAQIYGPAVIMDGVCISKGAVIIGPTIIGNNVSIGEDSVVVNSLIWDGAQTGPNCRVQRCLIDYHAVVKGNSVLQEKSIPLKPELSIKSWVDSAVESWVNRTIESVRNIAHGLQHALQPQFDKINENLPTWARSDRKNVLTFLAGGLILIAFLWSYWPGIIDLWSVWQGSDEYSSGLLVPFLTVYILWSRRHDLIQCRIKPCAWGILAFSAAQVIRLLGLFLMYGSAERLSIALSIGALVLLLFGWQLFRKVSTVLLFLCLMLPWPHRIQAAVALPLQRWATSSAVFCLELMGYEVLQEGNIIHIGQASVAVAEACNGLRMVTAFFVISGLVVLLVKRAWWEKLIVLASSLPIALLCNTTRLTITALAFTVISGEYWEKIFHDFGGYAMMPLALAAVVGELWLLAKLTTLPTKQEAIIVTRQNR